MLHLQKQGFTLQLFFNQPVARASFLPSQDSWCGGRGFIHSADLLLFARLHTKAASQSPQFSSVQSLSHVRLFATPWIAARQASLSITNSRSLLKVMSIESVMPPNHPNPHTSRLQSFPASGSFPVSQFLASGGQSIGVSASASVLPMNIQDWFPLGWTGWISLQYKELSKSLLQRHSSKAPQTLLGRPEQMPQMGWLHMVERCSLTALKVWSSESRCCQALSLNPAGEDPPRLPQLPLAAGSLGVPRCASVALRSLPPHITRSLPCASSSCLLCVSKFSLSEDTSHRIRAHPNPVSPGLMLVISANNCE